MANKKLTKALSNVGGSLGQKELNRIKTQLGLSSGVKSAAKNLGINIKGSGGSSSASTPDYGFSGFEGMTPAEFDFTAAGNLAAIQGGIDKEIANINSASAKQIARIGLKGTQYAADKELEAALAAAGASRYTADQILRGTLAEAEASKFSATTQKEAMLGVETIRSKGALDLQAIVNAGNKEVETLRGEYGLKGKQIDRSTAVLGGLVSAFNFS